MGQKPTRIRVTTFEPDDDFSGLEICLTCFGLHGMYNGREHRCGCQPRDDDWRESHWSGYDIAASIDMCSVCGRRVMRTGSRWSWYACDLCRNVNIRVGEAIAGPRAFVLPLGRHSMMNGIALSGREVPGDAATAEFVVAMKRLTGFWNQISSWHVDESKRLAGSIPLEGSSAPLNEWLEYFPSSLGASVDAFCRFLDADLPDKPTLARLRDARDACLNGDTGYEEILIDMDIDRVDAQDSP